MPVLFAGAYCVHCHIIVRSKINAGKFDSFDNHIFVDITGIFQQCETMATRNRPVRFRKRQQATGW